jgi:hypothetical protein
VLLTIECKWLEAIVHMTKSEFLDLLHPKQVPFIILIRNHDKFRIPSTSAVVGFQEDIQQFIPQGETNLEREGLVVRLPIIHIDNV